MSDKRYEWFHNRRNNSKKNKNSHKNNLKKAWKIIRLIIYLTLLAFSLTGCVQQFILKTDTKTGVGYEFYDEKTHVAPHVNSLNYDVSTSEYTLDSSNYYLSSGDMSHSQPKDKKTLELIHKQVNENGGTWGGYSSSDGGRGWISHSQSIRLIGGSTPILKSNNKYLINSDTMQKATDFGAVSLKPIIIDGKTFTFVKVDKPIIVINKNSTKDEIEEFKNENDQYFRYVVLDKLLTLNKVSLQNMFKQLEQLIGLKIQETTASKAYSVSIEPKKGLISLYSISPSRPVVSWADSWRTGPFYALFVFPLAKLGLALTGSMGDSLSGWESIWTILIIVIVVKSVAYLLSFKSTLEQVKQQEIQAKVAIINAKYEAYKDNKQMQQRKRMEQMELYKNEGISPMGSLGTFFLTLPILIAMLRVISAVPHIKSTKIGGVLFSATSYQELFGGNFEYLPLMLIAGFIQVLSALIPRLFARSRNKKINVHQKHALKKQNKMQNIMLIVVGIFALAMTAGLEIYLIFSGLYTIGQNVANHYIIRYQSKHRKKKKLSSFNI